MGDNILNTLQTLREYARGLTASRGCDVELSIQAEESHLMRFANSAISLNANEHLIRLHITAVDERKRANSSLLTSLGDINALKQAVATVMEMVDHAQPLTYEPTVPVLSEPYTQETHWNQALATMPNGDKLDFFNEIVEGMETRELKLSGIFSSGTNTLAVTNTKSDHALFFKTSDAQVTTVLAHEQLKWEIIAEQSAQQISDLNPAPLHRELALLKQHYEQDQPQRLALGNHDIVFGPAAIASMVDFMDWVGFDGGTMKRGYAFLSEGDIGKRVFSPKLSVTDDPTRRETYPQDRDMNGMVRTPWPLIAEGRFSGFTWSQDDADEFNQKPTGHTIGHKSLSVSGGDNPIASLEGLINAPRDRDILYVPFLHYMNLVNPTKGIITASSRFGALLLTKDGDVKLPFNVRLTQSLLDIFSEKVAWLTRDTIAYNTSGSYGARNPTAIVVPRYIKVRDLEISHSNASF